MRGSRPWRARRTATITVQPVAASGPASVHGCAQTHDHQIATCARLSTPVRTRNSTAARAMTAPCEATAKPLRSGGGVSGGMVTPSSAGHVCLRVLSGDIQVPRCVVGDRQRVRVNLSRACARASIPSGSVYIWGLTRSSGPDMSLGARAVAKALVRMPAPV